ncbi:partial 4-hydroxy-3-methylbut-2-enyl diphosphate reductase, partial [Rhodocyclaceae bacterium]
EGTMGQANCGMYLVENVADVEALQVKNPAMLAFVTQTTLSMDDAEAIIAALRRRFPEIVGPRKDDICYATQNRQDAVRKMSDSCDLMLVVGSPTSSNSNRLREVAAGRGLPAYLIDGPDEIKSAWVAGCKRVGVTAGASAPEVLVERVIGRLRELGATDVVNLDGVQEGVVFPMLKFD